MKDLIEGNVNYLKNKIGAADDSVERESKRKMAICKPCDFRKDNRCGLCGCPLATLTRSKKSCLANNF